MAKTDIPNIEFDKTKKPSSEKLAGVNFPLPKIKILPKITDVATNISMLGNTEISGKYFLLVKKINSGRIKKQANICQTDIEEKTAKNIEIAKIKIINSLYPSWSADAIENTNEIKIFVPNKLKKLKKEASSRVRVKASNIKIINLSHFIISLG